MSFTNGYWLAVELIGVPSLRWVLVHLCQTEHVRVPFNKWDVVIMAGIAVMFGGTWLASLGMPAQGAIMMAVGIATTVIGLDRRDM